jgi:hypothetical protein
MDERIKECIEEMKEKEGRRKGGNKECIEGMKEKEEGRKE